VKSIGFERDAMKYFRRIPSNEAANIRAKIEQYAHEPAGLAANVVQLSGCPGVFRLRVRVWRVIFTETADAITILKIAPRGSAYE
jgi:mRNA interferase RelE/StbE